MIYIYYYIFKLMKQEFSMDQEFPYPVSKRALEKWSKERLELLEKSDEKRLYRFRYSGSTCTNGGTPFEAHMNVEILGAADQATIKKAWIEFPEEERESAARMCTASGGTDQAQRFFGKLTESHDISGRRVEEVITEDVQVNHAGCFCAPAMVRDKWNQVLSTIHWLENSRN